MRACISVGLLFVLSISRCHGAVEYYGKFIAPLKSFYHDVSGDVYAVDARTIHIRNFNYDGEGPVAYFYVGSTSAVNGNGHRLLDERGLGQPLKRYRRRHITLTLPEGKTLANIKWFAVWCDEAQVNFGDVKIPKSLDFPRPQKLAQLNGVHAVSSEPVVVVDAQTLLIPSFSYDGEAPDAKFWVGRGSKPSPQGIRVPDENGKELPLRPYNRKTIVLTLPGDLTMFDTGHFGVWCEAFTVDFGHIQIPSGLNVPPSLKMLGVSPQKRSRSLQLSALDPPQQLRQEPSNYKQRVGNRDKSYNNNFNYQNVLPLFNPQETIRPTTYRPQLFAQPTTIDPQSLQGADHRFSQKHTDGYLPLNQLGQSGQQRQNLGQLQYNTVNQHRSFPTPSVQIIPSISLNDDNALIQQNQFDLGPLNQQVYLDPAYYNPQLQPDHFRNGHNPFLINVQDEQFAYQRPIRKGSDNPPVNSIPSRNVNTQTTRESRLQQLKQKQTKRPSSSQATVKPTQPTPLQTEPFQIPLIPQGSGLSISSSILAEEFQQTFVDNQPRPRQAEVPVPQEFLTVPRFINDGLFSTDFGTITPQVVRPETSISRVSNFGSTAAAQNVSPVSRPAPRGPPRTIPAFRNNPEGSFSRFVLSSGSSIHDTLSKLNCEVLHEDLAFEVRWAVAGDSVVIQLVAKLENGEYMSFGVSGHERKNKMIGADVVVAGVNHETLNGFADDYFLDDKSQCSGTRGSCPDYRIDPANTNSVKLLNAALVNGYSIVTYQRPLKAHDHLDLPIYTNTSQAFIWGVGPLNEKMEVSFHSVWSKENILLDFGRTPQWNCPIPESDAALAASSHEEPEDVHVSPSTAHTQAQDHAQPAAERYQTPPPPAAAVKQSDAWEIPPIQCNEPDDGVFYAQMGPTGGKRGYPSITKHVGWGISYYINGLLIPEINVVRGKTYTFVVEGGLDPSVPAKYHPFYITDDPVGGYVNKSPDEQKKVRIFAGVEQTRSGVLVPTGVGRLCNWTPDPEQPPADEFVSFGAYQRTLTLICDHGEPGVIQWTPDEDTPDTVYYQCFTHRYLGWKINVLDQCDLPAVAASAPVETRVKYEPEADELESRPSQRVATRVKPEGPNYLPLVSTVGLKNQDLMAEYKKNFAQIPVNFQEPQEPKYESHHGIASNHKYPASTMDVYINEQIQSTTEDGRQMIPVSEDTSQDTSTERNRPVLSHVVEKNNTNESQNHHQTATYNRSPYPQGSVKRPMAHQRRPVMSSMTIIRPHRRPAPHHHMMMVAKPVMHRPYTLMSAPSQYRPVYVKKPIYRMPSVGMHRPVMVIPQPVPADTVMVPPRAPSNSPQVTKTVSVSYSSSKGKVKPQVPVQMKSEPVENKKYILPQHKPYKPESTIPHYKASQSITTGGFNPGSLVIEGGFKPIIQSTPEAQDRISEAEEIDDTEGTIDLTTDDEGPKEINIDSKATEYFEPMFIPSPPDSMQKHAKKPTGLEYDVLQKKKTYISRKPVRQNMIVIRRRPVSPSSRAQQDDTLDETPMAAERMDTYYLPPSGPIYGVSQLGQVAVPANTDSGAPTLLTYDGKLVSGNSLVPPPPNRAFSSPPYKRKTSTAELLRSTPQFGPFRGDIPPPVPENIRPENIPQLKFKSDDRPAHAMALTLDPEPTTSQGRTQLSLVRQVEEEEESIDGLVPEASELEEYKYDVSGEENKSNETVIIVLAETVENATSTTESELSSDKETSEQETKTSHVHKRDRRYAHNVPSYGDDKEYHMQHDHEHLKLMENGTMPKNNGLRLATSPTSLLVSLLSFVYYML